MAQATRSCRGGIALHHALLSRSVVPPFAPSDFQLIFAAPLINSAAHGFVKLHDFIQPSFPRKNRPQGAIIIPRVDDFKRKIDIPIGRQCAVSGFQKIVDIQHLCRFPFVDFACIIFIICYETHQKAKDILEGRKIDPTFYPVIYGADETDDWTDPEVWKKANPSLGITVGIDKVEAACESAKQNPGEENSFRQLRLNQWVKQAVRWMPMEKWDACSFKVDEDALEGRVCYGGLDLSSTTDITAFVLVFPPLDEDDKFCILPYFWIPEDTLELRVRRDHVPYDVWERQGYLETTEGNVVHYGYIEKFIEHLGERFNIREIAFDRWGAVQMVQNLEGMGFTVVPFGQGFKDMSPPTKELMKLTLEQRLAHGGHPVLRWMMDNIYIRTDPAGNVKADKEKSTEKIDGAVATIMGLDRAIRCGNNTGASVYDDRGILFL